MKVGVCKEISPEETRVAATPETVTKMIRSGMEVVIESDAGSLSSISNTDYETAGASIASSHKAVFEQADVLLKVHRPLVGKVSDIDEIALLKPNTILISPLYPFQHLDLVEKLAAKKITVFSMDLLPRIARAQSMDILSSMSSIAGYKSIIMASDLIGKLFPMMTTAAGTIPPAKVLVIGAGVAGLQAIATARRLGGVIIAFDTRPAAGEQVKSLGADFVSLETSHEQSQDTGGYAKEQSAAFYQHEQETIAKYSCEADIIVTTALIPGKRAPLLITEAMVKQMKPGSIIVDIAAEQQGNCEITEPGKIVTKYGVTIVGLLNLPSKLPIDASQLYARNLYTFLSYVTAQLKNGGLDLEDDIIRHTLVTYQGNICHTKVNEAIQQKGNAHVS